jgi:hypothetical protein
MLSAQQALHWYNWPWGSKGDLPTKSLEEGRAKESCRVHLYLVSRAGNLLRKLLDLCIRESHCKKGSLRPLKAMRCVQRLEMLATAVLEDARSQLPIAPCLK